MVKILAVHSFRGGTGKSNLSANLAVALAQLGKRVAVIDTDLASPGVHVLFGFAPQAGQQTLNDYLQGPAAIHDCAYEVTPGEVKASHGNVWLVPASMNGDRIADYQYGEGILLTQGLVTASQVRLARAVCGRLRAKRRAARAVHLTRRGVHPRRRRRGARRARRALPRLRRRGRAR